MSRGWYSLQTSYGLSAFALLLCIGSSAALSSSNSNVPGQEVEFSLATHDYSEDGTGTECAVELRNSSGRTVRIVRALMGDKIHFKHLQPDIYQACLQGQEFPKKCQSFDLYPPRESRSYKFNGDIAAPSASMPNVELIHTVNVEQLHVPEKARGEFIHSVEALEHGDVNEEVLHLQRAIDIAPDYAEALNNLGYYYHLNGNEALSVKYLARATSLDSESYLAWCNLAGALTSLKKWDEALNAGLRALALKPDSVGAILQVGNSYFKMRRYPEAEKHFKKALELDPATCGFPMLHLANIALVEDRKDEARAYLQIFLKIHPNHPWSSYWMEVIENLNSGKQLDRISLIPEMR